jgi:hypothetical protein
MIRPDGQASWRSKTKPKSRNGGSSQPTPARHPYQDCLFKLRMMTFGCLMTGRREGAVRGLGTPVRVSCWMSSRAGGRGVVVPMKPVKAGGGKDARKSDPEGQTW